MTIHLKYNNFVRAMLMAVKAMRMTVSAMLNTPIYGHFRHAVIGPAFTPG
jgi:hypothetical protein